MISFRISSLSSVLPGDMATSPFFSGIIADSTAQILSRKPLLFRWAMTGEAAFGQDAVRTSRLKRMGLASAARARMACHSSNAANPRINPGSGAKQDG